MSEPEGAGMAGADETGSAAAQAEEHGVGESSDDLSSLLPGEIAEPRPDSAHPDLPSVSSIDVSDLEMDATQVAGVALPELGGERRAAGKDHFGLLLDVGVEVAAVVGTRELKLEQILAIQPGAIIDLEKSAGEPVELYVNGKPIALAEIVVVDGRLGARVVETLGEVKPR